MKKTIQLFSSAIIVGGLLAGCGGTANKASQDNNNGLQNVGYYSNKLEQSPNGKTVKRYGPQNDVNNGLTNQSDQFAWDNPTARRISSQVNRLKGVKDSSVLITGDSVIIGVQTSPGAPPPQTMEQQVRGIVKSYVRDKHIRVVTNKNIVNRMSDVNLKMDTGTGDPDKIQADVRGIEKDLGVK
ncbi:MAG TPA: YhcN/YlaJ family sporulation lipoprotein [Candidatus Angelobacter sp.]|nr:YhcN/YlaJ family sporulation lipoprotein [Candidatus Angelobacter sp.]